MAQCHAQAGESAPRAAGPCAGQGAQRRVLNGKDSQRGLAEAPQDHQLALQGKPRLGSAALAARSGNVMSMPRAPTGWARRTITSGPMDVAIALRQR